ncbi:DUF262 domain-containing protein [Okibacterium endophyticum]
MNRDYQRSDTVWPLVAKSFLIETILLDYPVPKMSLHQKLDIVSRDVHKEIVDGQQRSRAIRDFYEGKLRLSRTTLAAEFAGRTLSELSEEAQAQFLNYGLNFDIFVNARDEEVREVFRRMNSFTVPLNPEETRHATFQGPFKWFVHRISRDYDVAFESAGVFTEKQINRMSDAKLLTEILHTLSKGFATTTKASLTALYRDNNTTFEYEEELDSTLRSGLDAVLFDAEIQGTALMKSYNFYSLVLAHIYVADLWEIPGDNFNFPEIESFESGNRQANLLMLDAAVSDAAEAAEHGDPEEEDSEFAEFVSAAKDRTNVASQRQRRFEFFVSALRS